jgi:hypothetical protein
MEHGVVVRGRIHGRHIELDEAVDEFDGEVEVFVRGISTAMPASRLLEIVASFPAGSRSKDAIDHDLAEDRSDWDRRG